MLTIKKSEEDSNLDFKYVNEKNLIFPACPENTLGIISKKVADRLVALHLKLATAESCTGGLVAKTLTDLPGSSTFFEYGIVSYSNRIKNKMLGVDEKILSELGAVSPEVAVMMAKGARHNSDADIGIGITGVAGPGPDGEKAEGEIYVSISTNSGEYVGHLHTDTENQREYNRNVSALNALHLVLLYLDNELN